MLSAEALVSGLKVTCGAGLSSTEQQRFSIEGSKGSLDYELANMDSNTWVEVNYTQLVANAQRLLPQVKPGAIPLAMVKVMHRHCTSFRPHVGFVHQLHHHTAVTLELIWDRAVQCM